MKSSLFPNFIYWKCKVCGKEFTFALDGMRHEKTCKKMSRKGDIL